MKVRCVTVDVLVCNASMLCLYVHTHTTRSHSCLCKYNITGLPVWGDQGCDLGKPFLGTELEDEENYNTTECLIGAISLLYTC